MWSYIERNVVLILDNKADRMNSLSINIKKNSYEPLLPISKYIISTCISLSQLDPLTFAPQIKCVNNYLIYREGLSISQLRFC